MAARVRRLSCGTPRAALSCVSSRCSWCTLEVAGLHQKTKQLEEDAERSLAYSHESHRMAIDEVVCDLSYPAARKVRS